MIPSTASTLLIPSETRVREFDAKLLMACLAAEQGHECIVGSRMAMHLHVARLPVGTYVAKDMFRSSARMLGILRGLGHDVVGWDEESLVYISRELYLRHRVSAETTRRMRRVFAWGEEDREAKAAAQAFEGIPVEAVGNPRMDLLRPELRGYFADEASALRARHGRYVMVNSNFGRLNHLLPSQRLDASEANRAAYEAANAAGLPFDYWQFRDRIFCAMKAMVPALADAFPRLTVVIRPHPSEDHGEWLRVAEGRANVTVTNEGPAIPWLLGAEAVIHNGCTTGLEAYLLGRTAICYQPEMHELWDLELPNAVSDSVASELELIERVEAAIRGDASPQDGERKRTVAQRYLSGLEGPLASEVILDRIRSHAATDPLPAIAPAERRAAMREAWRRSVSKRINALIPGHKNSARYTRQRFPDIELPEVTARVEKLGSILGRFGGVRAERLHANVFRIVSA